jgi:hypothetical protein
MVTQIPLNGMGVVRDILNIDNVLDAIRQPAFPNEDAR